MRISDWSSDVCSSDPPRRKPGRAQLLQPAVEPLSSCAIIFIGRIAQREHGKPHAIELGRFAALDKFEKASGGLGRIALAISADDDEQILLLTKLPNLIVRHIGEICRDRKSTRLNSSH